MLIENNITKSKQEKYAKNNNSNLEYKFHQNKIGVVKKSTQKQ